jgi:SAM-dependent methyltransferase
MDMKAFFTDVYDNKVWGHDETVSGPGSTLGYTANLRRELPVLFQRFNIRSILDAPCGDMNWMSRVMAANPGIDYTGGDIVKPMVAANAAKYARRNIRFVELDITADPLPKADLMICRDCLFHLEQRKIVDFIANFRKSAVTYLLTTSYLVPENFNADIPTGNFFPIDLMAAPYNFPRNVLYGIDDWIEGFFARRMYLWQRSQIPECRLG